jgi:hypothetical protein
MLGDKQRFEVVALCHHRALRQLLTNRHRIEVRRIAAKLNAESHNNDFSSVNELTSTMRRVAAQVKPPHKAAVS